MSKGESKLVRDALKVIKKWGVVSVEILSRELGLPPPVVNNLINYLKERGYLREEKCGMACDRCPLAYTCSRKPVKLYRLAEEV